LLSVVAGSLPLYRFVVVVVGAGVAGATAALAAADAGIEVALLTKADLAESNTLYAQGGVAAVLAPDDSFEEHVADTLTVGCGLSERAVVESLVRDAPAAIAALEARGARWDRRRDGRVDLSREGGHSHARVIHARGDATGREIEETLAAAVTAHPRITVFA